MNTHSHFLMTVLLNDRLKQRSNEPVLRHNKALLLGSVMPDLPLFVLTFGYFAYRYWLDPLLPDEHIFGPRYDNLYFNNSFWIGSHNFFHAPLMIVLLAGLGYVGLRRRQRWGVTLLWFALGCGLHSVVDILTHHNDGPLLFFPFDWQLRLVSPVSYWDPNHYGWLFAPISLVADLAIIGYFAVRWWQQKSAQTNVALTR